MALPNVSLDGVNKLKLRVSSHNNSSIIEVRAGSPDGAKLATLKFGPTGMSSYEIPSLNGTGATLNEMKYSDVIAEITHKVKGKQNVYLVFKDKDIRVDQIQLIH